MMVDFEFLQPYWFASLILPLLIIFLRRYLTLLWPELNRPLNSRYPFLSAIISSADQVRPNYSANYSYSLILILLIFALTQPVRVAQNLPIESKAEAVDLILVVNTSVSMVLEDYVSEGQAMDRMSMTRKLLLQLIDRFKGRRISLVLLGRPASVWLPLTQDKHIVKQAVKSLRTTLGGRSSDISATLELVGSAFSITDKNQNKIDRVVLLVSDGYQQLGASAPDAAVQKLVDSGFQLHSLAIGKSLAFQPQGQGQLIYRPVDLEMLRHLAEIGRGTMVQGLDDSSIDQLLDILHKPHDQPSDIKKRRQLVPLYPLPLIVSMILLCYQLLWPGKKWHVPFFTQRDSDA